MIISSAVWGFLVTIYFVMSDQHAVIVKCNNLDEDLVLQVLS